ncbi:MAG: bifunctional DNA-formamidopyrimidine glycosylase/DNA-(apurinic or apyrimidinic site) lyase [Patescibacteria group bacterium]
MPELPEVETITRDLAPVLLRKKILGLKVSKVRLLKNPQSFFQRHLVGSVITSVSRRAKMILLGLSSGYTLIIHLKMTGQLVWHGLSKPMRIGGHPITGVDKVPNRYTYITLSLPRGAKLYFNDTRTFGYWQLVKSAALKSHFHRLGPEPLQENFTAAVLAQQLKSHGRASIKAALLNQTVLAGLGNIYVDESLFAAGLKPTRLVAEVKTTEVKKLVRAIKLILLSATVARGTSFSNYRDGLGRSGTYWDKRLVYGRRGEPCRRCSRPILKTVVAGRGTHFCAKCQK